MHITVGISTWNRAGLLDGTLSSLAEVSVPEGVTWDVIVANNNSTDETDAVLRKHDTRLPLTTLFVGQQGKSYALNELVDRLSGDLVLWTDDDVEFSKDWIGSYVRAARRWPKAAFFGGHIIPRFLAEEPDWLRPAWHIVSGVYAARELGEEPFAFDRKRLPFGANMAVRVSLQKQYQYDPQLGRRGELLLAGEETALAQQWLADGHVGMWVPDSRVEHIITPDRFTLEHLQRFFFSLAESKPGVLQLKRPVSRFLRGAYYVLRALKYQTLIRSFWRETRPAKWITYITRISYCWGRVQCEWRHLPRWLKPGPVMQHLKRRQQPRFRIVDSPRDIEQTREVARAGDDTHPFQKAA